MTTGPESRERDPALERAWRAHSSEAPPPELDRAILAAAHRAAGSGPAKVEPGREANRPQRWWMPLAAAATIGAIAVGLLQMSPRDESVVAPTERIAAVAPQRELAKTAPAASPTAAGADAKARIAPAAPPRPADNETAAKYKQDALPPPASAPPVPAAPPAPTAGAREAPAVAGKLAERAPEPFPTAPAPRKVESAAMKNPPPAADAPTPAGVAQASRAEPVPASAANIEQDKREVTRKDFAEADRQKVAATPPAAPAQAGAGAVSSLAAAPAPPAPAAATRTRDNAFARDASREQAAPAAPALAKRAAPSEEARMKARDPDAWIAQIRKLRDEGRTADAIRELRDFRELVPDADRRIPADLRDLAAAIRP
ncbi:MAG: hypothetical protein U1F58_08585 [Burkholderiales bacterium]